MNGNQISPVVGGAIAVVILVIVITGGIIWMNKQNDTKSSPLMSPLEAQHYKAFQQGAGTSVAH